MCSGDLERSFQWRRWRPRQRRRGHPPPTRTSALKRVRHERAASPRASWSLVLARDAPSAWLGLLAPHHSAKRGGAPGLTGPPCTGRRAPSRRRHPGERRATATLARRYLARTTVGHFQTHLPLFKQSGVGCINWGLEAGRTQTQYPWYSPPGAPEPTVWYHDIVRPDGSPYDAAEVEFIRRMTAAPAEDGPIPAPSAAPTCAEPYELVACGSSMRVKRASPAGLDTS